MNNKNKCFSAFMKSMKKIKLVDRCLILFMTVLMLQSIYNLFSNEANSEESHSIDIVVRTTSAGIFGYFLSANFIKVPRTKSAEKQGNPTADAITAQGGNRQLAGAKPPIGFIPFSPAEPFMSAAGNPDTGSQDPASPANIKNSIEITPFSPADPFMSAAGNPDIGSQDPTNPKNSIGITPFSPAEPFMSAAGNPEVDSQDPANPANPKNSIGITPFSPADPFMSAAGNPDIGSQDPANSASPANPAISSTAENSDTELERRSDQQMIIATVIGLTSLLVLIIARNFVPLSPATIGTLSQMRDFVSGCVGFLLGSPDASD